MLELIAGERARPVAAALPVAIRGLATAVPEHRVTTDAIWSALAILQGRRMAAGTLAAEVPRSRFLSAPLDWVMSPHTQDERTDAYLEKAAPLARRAATAALDRAGIDAERVGLIVCVSCTGFVLPSLDAALAPALGLPRDVARLPITELGCGGGLSGLARAHDYLRAYPGRVALVVAVEVPSLTFRPEDRSIDNLIASLVFSDGAGAAVLDAASPGPGWEVRRCGSYLVPQGARDLGYELRDGGFKVVLSRRLPAVVAGHLRPAVEAFLDLDGLTLADVDQVVAHPGGPRIFDAIVDGLGVAPGQLAASRRTFTDWGNASSAGIFFALSAPPDRGVRRALALAFGPGLSIEMAQLVWG